MVYGTKERRLHLGSTLIHSRANGVRVFLKYHTEKRRPRAIEVLLERMLGRKEIHQKRMGMERTT